MDRKSFKAKSIVLLMAFVVFLGEGSCKNHKGDHKELNAQIEKKQYVCSMHPDVIRDAPGDCPICGMFLIEKVNSDNNSYDTSLIEIVGSVNESVMASAGTVSPVRESLPLVIEASGIINYDPRKIQTISARFAGLIERSFVKYQFQHIRKGQKIYEIYCPDIYNEQWNYVKLVQAYPDNDELTSEAVDWLNLLGLSEGQIDSLKRTNKPDYHLPVYSYAEGYAVNSDFDPESFFSIESKEERNPLTSLAGAGNNGIDEGISVEKGAALLKLIDVRALRVDLKVKTEDGSLLEKGQKVIITDAAIPDKQFSSSINQIEPLNGGIFQTVRVYITDNERLMLPGRQIKAMIMAGIHTGLWIPATALVDLGQRRSVFVLHGNKFIHTEVTTGVRYNELVEILSGVDQNSIIAENALLLTDSDGLLSHKK